MKTSEINVGEFSDVHLGHPIMKTEHVIESLRRAFPDNDTTGQLDIIFIAGDLFDRNLTLSNLNNYIIRPWMRDFLLLCKKRNIILRVLRGTPLHDWEQSRLFTHINELMDIGADVKYVNTLEIEFIDSLGISVLYIPDEWRHYTQQTQDEVAALLVKHGLEQVDFTVMHGQFKHQLPKVTHDKLQFHSADYYLSITRYFIFVGHIHIQSQYERILAAGSFGRMSHGEEKAKGHYRVRVRQNGQHEIFFIANKQAKKFITLRLKPMSLEETYIKASTLAAGLPDDSHIRLIFSARDAVNAPALKQLQRAFPNIHWKEEADEVTTKPSLTMVDDRPVMSRAAITPQNVEELLMMRIHQKHSSKAALCQQLLQEAISE